jgi:hypothetical protein
LTSPDPPAELAQLVHVWLLLAHDYLGFQMKHADDLLALVANPLAVVARFFIADTALAVNLIPWNQRLADIALPELVHWLTGLILSAKHLGQSSSSTAKTRHLPQVFLPQL